MAKDNAILPFARGTYDTTGAFAHLLGREYVCEYLEKDEPKQGGPADGRLCVLRLVKNNSGIALLPKRLAKLDATAGKVGVEAVAYAHECPNAADAAFSRSAGVDEFLPASGVPNGAYFYVVVGGPAMLTMAYTEVGDIAAGDVLVAQTSNASTAATDAGRVVEMALAGSSATTVYSWLLKLALQDGAVVGEALSAVSSSETGEDILVDIYRHR